MTTADAVTVPAAVLKSALELYLGLHMAPELSGAEERTAERFADWLAADGYAVTRGIGGHGVAAVLRRGPGPTVLLRAELDALPVTEETGLRYASRVPGAMHACGHDLHLAALAGAARLLARESAPGAGGTIVVVGQPAEETLDGARAMLRDGLYERFGTPDAVLAQHTATLPAGSVAHGLGPLLAGSVAVDAVLHGTGGHAGAPHLTVDPVVAAAAAVLRLQGVVSRETPPAEQAVLTVGRLRAGERSNVVPDHAELGISLRAFGEAALKRMEAAVRRVVTAESEASGCPRPPRFEVVSHAPPLVADAALTEEVRAAHLAAFGTGRVTRWAPAAATEDFGWFGPAGAGLHGGSGIRLGYWMLGTVGAARLRAAAQAADGTGAGASVPGNHSPAFAPEVRTALPAGIVAMASAARRVLGGGQIQPRSRASSAA
ncbi:amidohydrolase [Streptomyces johnsoniae]|uniref:Amidohydrolase n=1 Tax=Streptomyces johnsoniae TaxID=3075532 RepID=A0ABU2S6Q4_9ACTN|nr:amidohydrolase [Streptomyces sp. DSM 41886]MDT0444346.1 amidohydrolase [Streptomyces sp. DSM 41886]